MQQNLSKMLNGLAQGYVLVAILYIYVSSTATNVRYGSQKLARNVYSGAERSLTACTLRHVVNEHFFNSTCRENIN